MPGPPADSQTMDTTAAGVAGSAPAGTPPATTSPPAGTLLTQEELAAYHQQPPTEAAAAAAAATQPSGAAAADTRSQAISTSQTVLLAANQAAPVWPAEPEEDDLTLPMNAEHIRQPQGQAPPTATAAEREYIERVCTKCCAMGVNVWARLTPNDDLAHTPKELAEFWCTVP